jgi:hypothetical protein
MSVSAAPVYAADEAVTLAEKVKAFVAMARQRAVGGLTVREFGELVLALMRIAVSEADAIPVSGAAKKEWVVQAVGILFDELSDFLVPTIAKPLWVLFRPGFRALLLKLVDGMIEALLPLIRGEQ